MFSVYLKPGLKFLLNNNVYEILKILNNGSVQVQNERFADISIYTREELIIYLNSGDLKFEVKGKKNLKANESSIKTSFDFEDIDNIKHKNQAIFRYEVIKPLLKVSYNNRKYRDIEERVNQINDFVDHPSKRDEEMIYYKKVSKSSVYRWLADYEESGGDIRSLIPSYHNSGGKNIPRMPQQVIDIIVEVIKEFYLSQQKVNVKEIYYILINKIYEFNEFSLNKLPFPSYPTIARYVQKIPEYELVASRIGKRTAEQRFSPIGNGVKVKYPLERVEIDATDLDIILLGPSGNIIGRPHFIAAIDKYSRNILGFSLGFGGVGWPEVMQCLRHVMTDKSYIKEKYPFIDNNWTAFGVPKTVIIDNGLGFKNNSMKDTSYQLGFLVEYAPPRVPEWKGSIERFFGTNNTSFVHNLPGTTRSNPGKLGDSENPENNACIPFSIFLGLLHKWIVDVYSQDLNKGAGGIPSMLWEEGINKHPVAWPNSVSELAILFGRVEYRLIRNRGIELNGLYYNSTQLNRVFTKFSLENNGRKEKFKIKYDPHNLGEVYVYDHILEKAWFRVSAVDLQYAEGISEWEHNEIKTHARLNYGQVDTIALAKSKAFIKHQIENWSGYSKKQLAKANKINSTKDIFGNENSFMDDQLYKSSNHNNNGTISDIGNKINIKTSTSPIIPTIQIKKDELKDNKVVQISKRKKKNKINSLPETLNSEDTFNTDEELTFEDLAGFRILSNIGRKLGE